MSDPSPAQPRHRPSGWPRLPESTRRRSGASFAVRLFTALGVALVSVGVIAYFLISDQLEREQIEATASAQQADAEGFELLARRTSHRNAIREIGELLAAVGRRPDTTEASLIEPDGEILASSDPGLVGTTDRAPQIEAAIRSGTARYGREEDPGEESSDFEFVTPVELPDGPHALETSFDSAGFDGQLAGVRRVLIAVVAVALVAVTALFYLLGGRALLRSHRLALARATLDGLTDLPNQRAFQADLEHALALGARQQEPLALAVVDLDRFKLVNDRYGHPHGDRLLKRTADVLREGRASDRAYRIGGDEFALLLANVDAAGARALVRRLERAFKEADVQASIGLATAGHGTTASSLRDEADAALYEAKRRGGGGAVGFDEIRGEVEVTTVEKREAVARLIEEKRLGTVLQPIWDLGTGALVGIEALSRPDPEYGFSGPSEAFDVAIETGLVHQLDVVCATTALHTASEIEIPDDARLFVNLAPQTLESDAGNADWFIEAVEHSGLAPERVVVEVTERIGSRVAPVIRSLEQLRARGFTVALDDVGTGNAGLEMLRRVDADYVKIDCAIVAAAPTEPNARAVLMAMATFAGQTGAFVIAEGVEDEETLEFLRAIEESELRPGRIIQGGQGFALGYPSRALADLPPSAWAEPDPAVRAGSR